MQKSTLVDDMLGWLRRHPELVDGEL